MYLNYINIAKCVIGVTIVFLGLILILMLCFPRPITTDSQICLPNGGESLECTKTGVRVYSFVSDVLEAKYAQIKENETKKREQHFKTFSGQGVADYNGPSSKMKPAAKLIGKNCHSKNATGMVPIDTWCTGEELSKKGGFLRHNVRYYKGRLVVPLSGNYSVYSFVEFYEPYVSPEILNQTHPIKHAVFKYSVTDDKNEELVVNAQARKIAKNEYEHVYGSHIYTVVDLKPGDELSVQVSNMTLLKYTNDNYFGLILI